MIKEWNPHWSPKFFMSDYSEAEISAVEQTFPATNIGSGTGGAQGARAPPKIEKFAIRLHINYA